MPDETRDLAALRDAVVDAARKLERAESLRDERATLEYVPLDTAEAQAYWETVDAVVESVRALRAAEEGRGDA